MDLSREQLLDAYRKMRRIRVFEEKLAELVMAGRLAGFLHLYAGEEAVAVGVCAASERPRLRHLDAPRPRPLHRQGRRRRAA